MSKGKKLQVFLSSEKGIKTIPDLLKEIESGANVAAETAAEAGQDGARAALDFTKQALHGVIDKLIVAEQMPKNKTGAGSKAAAKK